MLCETQESLPISCLITRATNMPHIIFYIFCTADGILFSMQGLRFNFENICWINFPYFNVFCLNYYTILFSIIEDVIH